MGQPCFSSAAEATKTPPISKALAEVEPRHGGSNNQVHAGSVQGEPTFSQKPDCSFCLSEALIVMLLFLVTYQGRGGEEEEEEETASRAAANKG